MYLSKELYSNVSVLKALQAVLKAKGRKVKGLNEQVQNALETLSPEAQQELINIVLCINTSFNYRKLRLKAIHNQKNNSEELRLARVWSYQENNPETKVDTSAKKFNYWERN